MFYKNNPEVTSPNLDSLLATAKLRVTGCGERLGLWKASETQGAEHEEMGVGGCAGRDGSDGHLRLRRSGDVPLGERCRFQFDGPVRAAGDVPALLRQQYL